MRSDKLSAHWPLDNDISSRASELFGPFWQSALHWADIFLVAWLNYRILKLIRGTRAWRVLGGVMVFLAALFLSDLAGLRTLNWILTQATTLAPVALVLLLLPELRQALEGFSRIGLWPERLPVGSESQLGARTLEEIADAVDNMAEQRIGALLVLERATRLDHIAENGVDVDSKVNAQVLESIFYEGNPLHDGATLIRNDRIVAASCRLPMSENPAIASHLHMRHRAGVGMSEQADCVVIMVSEERGKVSLALKGEITPIRGRKELREALNREMRGMKSKKKSRRRRSRSAEGGAQQDGEATREAAASNSPADESSEEKK
ncbi:MAG: diadenylate cyclase CdaA [Fimbriimonadaceae bacterium]